MPFEKINIKKILHLRLKFNKFLDIKSLKTKIRMPDPHALISLLDSIIKLRRLGKWPFQGYAIQEWQHIW